MVGQIMESSRPDKLNYIDDSEMLVGIMEAFQRTSDKLPVIFPVHHNSFPFSLYYSHRCFITQN